MQQILLAGGGVPSIVGPRLGESPMRTSALGKGATRSPTTPGLQNSPKKVKHLEKIVFENLAEKFEIRLICFNRNILYIFNI